MTSAALSTDITVEHNAWGDEENVRPLVERAVAQAIETAQLKLLPNSELSVVLSNDAQIRQLNAKWRDKDTATNVLSFPSDAISPNDVAGPLLGDIILAHETIIHESSEEAKEFENHLTHLVIHGFLHLFGYDHETDEEALVMEGLETKILEKLAISDPYSQLT